MPALIKTDFYGQISWIGAVVHRNKIEVETEKRDELLLNWDGVPGAAHSGRQRASDSRVLHQHKLGTQIANVRQISLVGQEEINQISESMGLENFNPAWLGANLVISGFPDFSHLPPGSRLQFENGTTLIVDMQNRPCHQIGMTIERDLPGQGKGFKIHSKGKRGVTAWVERPGLIKIGYNVRLHVPDQRAWQADEESQLS